ncbi:tetratricopeptide repeat protein 5 isoform X2 [Lepeophtheirus salmonis]|nr:tetratricopeptide repeat protein 5-like isoform X2 [Lepeophtheirus salmonis]
MEDSSESARSSSPQYESDVQKIQELVDDLYHYRNHFFEIEDSSLMPRKANLLHEKMEKTILDLDNLAGNPSLKAKTLYERGRALNVEEEYNSESEKLLAKAVKLDPSIIDAWNHLGECYWKKGDLNNAKICFEGALNQEENKISLKYLSIVLRQTKDPENRIRCIEEGLSVARKAVSLDTLDGSSWLVLGNAYLTYFFTISQNPRILKQAMSAYKQAEKDVVTRTNSELHYNKAIVLKYKEEYTSALDSFSHAIALDPTWDAPVKQKAALFRHLSDIQYLMDNQGKLKAKRFQNLVDAIEPDTQLGPFLKNLNAGSHSPMVHLKQGYFSDLVEGSNLGIVVLGKVICSVVCEDSVPFTFCIVDKKSNIIVVNLYNLSPGKGVIIGDSVAIADPFFTKIEANHDGKDIKFNLVRVESPLVLVINGKKAPSELQAGIQLSTFTKAN